VLCHDRLMGMSRMDAMMARRMMFSSIMGAIIGWERRAVDRPAGMRTMSLVCMGACLFTLSSVFAFLDGPMNWDASRVSAAIPSGVGFLGAGLIWKTTTGEGQDSVHQIHGLTTAASIWLAASIGVAVGGGYYFISLYSVILIVKVLKYGPRIFYQKDDTARYDSSSDDSDSEHPDDSSHASQSGAVISDLEYGLGGGRERGRGGLRGGERDALLQDWNHRLQTDDRFPPFSGYQYNSLPPERSLSFPQGRGEGGMGFRERVERGVGTGSSGVQMASRESAASLVSELSNSVHAKSPVRRHMTDKALTADKPASLLSS